DALDAFADHRRRRGVGETDVLAVAGNATSEMNVSQHRDTRFVQQAFAELLRIRATALLARFGDVGPDVEGAARGLAGESRHLAQEPDDQIAALEERR